MRRGHAEETSTVDVDGRRLRTKRTKEVIIEAVLELLAEGTLVPTAQEVADRAGIGLRTYFRRFKHVDALYEAVNLYARERYEAIILGGDRKGSLEERIEGLVESYASAFDYSNNIVLATKSLLWRSKVLRKNYAILQTDLKSNTENWLPEVRDLDAADQEAVHAFLSYEMWNRLREHQKLGKKNSSRIITSLVSGMLA